MLYTLLTIAVATYFVAVNVYSYMLLCTQKKSVETEGAKTVGDGKLFVAALLGGALGVYVSMFVNKYKLKSVLFMSLMPVIAVLYFYLAFSGGYRLWL